MLSGGGKIVLIHHVLSLLPMYWIQMLHPPKAVIRSLGKLCNAFLCDHSVDSKRVHWTVWEKLCFPVMEGGLGFRRFEDMLDASSTKL